MELKRLKKGEHFNSKYPQKFKRKVIEEYLRTGCAKMDLIRKYKIQSKSGITYRKILTIMVNSVK